MRPDKILSIVAFAMLFAALAIHYMAPPLPVAKPRYVPIEGFPARVGGWTQNSVVPVPAAVRLKLPTAHIVDRIYTDAKGQAVELMLLTATRRDDMHDPARCLPSQGWNVTDQRTMQLAGERGTALTIVQNGTSFDVYYWLSGYYAPTASNSSLPSMLERLRGRIVSRQQGMSLFVRLMTADNSTDTGALDDFASKITPVLDNMKAAALRPGERVDLSSGELVAKA